MKYPLTLSGLLPLICHSALIRGAVMHERDTGISSSGTYVLEVSRDWDHVYASAQALVAPLVNRQYGIVETGTSNPPSKLDYGGYWFASATAGGIKVQVLLDTGSADLWLVDPSAPSDATQGVETWNATKAAKTTLMKGFTFDIGYGQGGNGVSGNVYKSPVCIGKACTTMAVGSATKDQGLGSFPRSGIMGLAFKGGNSIQPTQQPTFMESLQPSLNQPVFTTKFTAQGDTSQIAFGGNPFKSSGNFSKAKVDNENKYQYSWSFQNVTYSKNGKRLGTFDVVFDTGGPMSSASVAIVRAYYKGIQGAKDVHGDATAWTVPCGTKMPDLVLDIHGQNLTIEGKRFYNGNTQATGDCTSWLVKENSPDRGVIGDPFFTGHVVIFNQKNATISWAKQS